MDDHTFAPEELTEKGKLSEISARVVLKCLYLASVGRPELLWTVNLLARQVTKWTKACDRRMERLISYIHHTKYHSHLNFVGDPPEDCFLALFHFLNLLLWQFCLPVSYMSRPGEPCNCVLRATTELFVGRDL